MHYEIINNFKNILDEASVLLKENNFPIYKYDSEKNPNDFQFKWDVLSESGSRNEPPKPIMGTVDANFTCKLCQSKALPIRNFRHTGKVPILILHYTAEFKKGGSISPKQGKRKILKTTEQEGLFDRMVKKVFNFSMEDLFFQEFPACMFLPDRSNDSDWKERLKNCEIHIVDTIQKYNIKAIIIMGGAAVLYYGQNKAKEYNGLIREIEFQDIKLPCLVLRSPEGILQLENKRKSLETKKDSREFKDAREEENQVKISVVENLTKLKETLEI